MTTLLPTISPTDRAVDAIAVYVVDSIAKRHALDYRAVTTADTATTADQIILCDATAGAFSETLYPVASNGGRTIWIVKTDVSANAVTVDGNASETINGSTTFALTAQYKRVELFCTGSAWLILNSN